MFYAIKFLGQQYCWSDTGSCVSETASTTILPNHLKSVDTSSKRISLETASTIVPGRKSYNNLKTTHYGLIDWPSPSDPSGISFVSESLYFCIKVKM